MLSFRPFLLPSRSSFLACSKRLFSNAPNMPIKSPRQPRYSTQNQQIINDYMIPGPALKFFKTKRAKRQSEEAVVDPFSNHALEQIYTTPARSMKYNEFDSAPTVVQERLAERIHRAITTMHSVEVLPNQWVTSSYTLIRGVKVSRNLRKCHVLYEPLSTKKKERGQIHRALQDYTPLLSTMIRSHAQIKHPLSIKFISDIQTKELEDIFKRISSEEEIDKEE